VDFRAFQGKMMHKGSAATHFVTISGQAQYIIRSCVEYLIPIDNISYF